MIDQNEDRSVVNENKNKNIFNWQIQNIMTQQFNKVLSNEKKGSENSRKKFNSKEKDSRQNQILKLYGQKV